MEDGWLGDIIDWLRGTKATLKSFDSGGWNFQYTKGALRMECRCGTVVKPADAAQHRRGCPIVVMPQTAVVAKVDVSRRIDLTGSTFGKWTVVGFDRVDKRRTPYWLVVCECGHEGSVTGGHLVHGKSRSCGCGSSLSANQKVA